MLPSHSKTLLTAVAAAETASSSPVQRQQQVVIIGAGWGGLAAAHTLCSTAAAVNVTIVEAAPRVGGLVRDGFTTITGDRPAEAGQHGFWNNYHNIYRLFQQLSDDDSVNFNISSALTEYAEQGQYSPAGLEAVWPVYRHEPVQLPTGLAQAVYTRFLNLPFADRLSALPLLVEAFGEFDDSLEAWHRFDQVSFRDLCVKLGVSRRLYEEALEPMILTGLFAPGSQCSAAAALGMAYFFVLQSQTAFDVQWCRGNIGSTIMDPWVQKLQDDSVKLLCGTRVTGFASNHNRLTHVHCTDAKGNPVPLKADHVILAVGASALSAFARSCPELGTEFRRFGNLRGTSVLATRLFLDRNLTIPYSANACWGFDEGVGMTMFDITALHGPHAPTVVGAPGSVVEIDYYHASTLLPLSDEAIVAKAKKDLDDILGTKCRVAEVVDAAIVRLPQGVNWYFPGSYQDMPDVQSPSLDNLYYCGDIVRTRHGSWSQEKAFVTGMQAANCVLGRPMDEGILPVATDEAHVRFGKDVVAFLRKMISGPNRSGPSVADFLW